MKLRARRLTAAQAATVWEEFYQAHGAQVMQDAYGWSRPDSRSLGRGERTWEFYDGEQRVGWGLCNLDLNDPDDKEAVIALGVFPEHQRKGYRGAIRAWMTAWARKHGAEYMRLIVNKENEAHYNRMMEESKEGPWVYSGDVWYPAPGFGIFVLPLEKESLEKKSP